MTATTTRPIGVFAALRRTPTPVRYLVGGVILVLYLVFAYPLTFPAPVKARYISAHQTTFGLGSALGPLFGMSAWAALDNGPTPRSRSTPLRSTSARSSTNS